MTGETKRAAAFEEFFVSEQPRLVAIALGWCGEPELAREVVQEALVRAYRDWQRVSELGASGDAVPRAGFEVAHDRNLLGMRDLDALFLRGR